MQLPVRPHRDTAPGMDGDYVVHEVGPANASSDPRLEFLPEQPADAHLLFVIEPVRSAPSRHVAQLRPQEQSLDRAHVPAAVERPHFLRVLDPRTKVLAVRRRATATVLAAHDVVARALVALRGGAVGTYGFLRRWTSHLARWTGRSGARLLEGMTSIGSSSVSRFRRVDGDVGTRGRAFWRRCGVATMLARVWLTRSIGAIARVMLMIGRHVSLAARSLYELIGASLRALVEQLLDRAHVPAAVERPHFLRVLDPRTKVLAVRRRATATVLAAHDVVARALVALRGGAVGTYGFLRRWTSHLARWTGRSGARLLEGMTLIGSSSVSRFRRVDGDVGTRGRAFWRRCGVATMLARAWLTRSIGAIARVMLMIGRHVSLAARLLYERIGASLRALVHNVRIPSGQRLLMQIPLSALDIRRVRWPVANATLLAFTGGTAIGACLMWLVGVLPPPAVARGPATDGRTATAYSATPVTKMSYSATPVTKPVERQEQAASSVSSPLVVVSTAITVTSAPAGAHVTVDGIGWGETPITIHHLPPGQKVIRVTKDGYESQQRIISVADAQRSAGVQVTLRARTPGPSEPRLSTDRSVSD